MNPITANFNDIQLNFPQGETLGQTLIDVQRAPRDRLDRQC